MTTLPASHTGLRIARSCCKHVPRHKRHSPAFPFLHGLSIQSGLESPWWRARLSAACLEAGASTAAAASMPAAPGRDFRHAGPTAAGRVRAAQPLYCGRGLQERVIPSLTLEELQLSERRPLPPLRPPPPSTPSAPASSALRGPAGPAPAAPSLTRCRLGSGALETPAASSEDRPRRRPGRCSARASTAAFGAAAGSLPSGSAGAPSSGAVPSAFSSPSAPGAAGAAPPSLPAPAAAASGSSSSPSSANAASRSRSPTGLTLRAALAVSAAGACAASRPGQSSPSRSPALCARRQRFSAGAALREAGEAGAAAAPAGAARRARRRSAHRRAHPLADDALHLLLQHPHRHAARAEPVPFRDGRQRRPQASRMVHARAQLAAEQRVGRLPAVEAVAVVLRAPPRPCIRAGPAGASRETLPSQRAPCRPRSSPRRCPLPTTPPATKPAPRCVQSRAKRGQALVGGLQHPHLHARLGIAVYLFDCGPGGSHGAVPRSLLPAKLFT
jgi:hypothetical protein